MNETDKKYYTPQNVPKNYHVYNDPYNGYQFLLTGNILLSPWNMDFLSPFFLFTELCLCVGCSKATKDVKQQLKSNMAQGPANCVFQNCYSNFNWSLSGNWN